MPNNAIQDLGYLLKKTQHSLRIRMDHELKLLDLTTPQYAVLSHLFSAPGASNAVLARNSFVTAQTMHGILSNLQKNGLIKRYADPTHGRIQCTELTPKGMDTLKQARIIIEQLEKTMTCSLSEKDRLLLRKLLSDCMNNLSMLS